MGTHKHSGTTLLVGALTAETGDLTILINLVVLEHSQFDLLLLVFVLFWCGVVLLFPFLGTTTQTQHQVECRLLLNVAVAKCTSILQLFASEDQTLLVRGNALFVLDLCFHIFNGIRWL